jgi:hypothetical protein
MMALLDLIPKWVWVALVAALSATSCKLKLDNTGLTLEIEKHATKIAQLETSIQVANADAARQSADMERAARAAEQAQVARAAANRRDSVAASAELERLRIALSAFSAKPAAAVAEAPRTDDTNPIPELFLDCSRRYVELAGKADGHANDAKTLMDAWPK